MDVVVADDDPLIRKLLGDLLGKDGHEVTLCPDGRSALEAALAREPELLISDLEMPGMSGLELIRDLRARLCRAPVLLIPSDPDHPSIPAALGCSGVDVLPKPFRVGEVRKAIARTVGARR